MRTGLRADIERNNKRGLRLLKSLLVPDAFNAVLWIRLHLALERKGLPTFLTYRYLYHVHSVEMARGCVIGPGLYLPHPRGLLFTRGTRIGAECSIYGNVRFVRKNDAVPELGDRVFVGDGAIFVGGAKAGDDCVVGAGSVVTKAFEAGNIIAGNPAKIMRKVSQA